MSKTILIRNAQIINEGKIWSGDVFIKDERIERVASSISNVNVDEEIDAKGSYLIPGIIDDQVHFREPGLTHKATIYTEAKAGIAGGVTSFMEMPNTVPPAVTHQLLEEKYALASKVSLANYSFYLGTSNDNLEEIKKVDPKNICGIKIFMGSSTGKLVVDDPVALENIFRFSPTLIATHCEDDKIIKENTEKYRQQYGDAIPVKYHPFIRDERNCYESSKLAISIAKKTNARLHILHISTAEELELFSNAVTLSEKRITAEACVHHLWFDSSDYEKLDTQIKCNPAIKDARHKPEILKALLDNRIDVIATDHAPHTWEEKYTLTPEGKINYFKSPSGLPLIQHSFNIMVELHRQGKISLERIVEKMCHAPAELFRIKDRGYIREGYYADLFLFNPNTEWTVTSDSLLYKCKWSPFLGTSFKGKVTNTFVNGNHVFNQHVYVESVNGKRLVFNR